MGILFALSWCLAVRIDNYSVVDAVWACGIGITASLWLLLQHGNGWKRGVAAGMIIAWSLRLGSHLAVRIQRAHPQEDPRYAGLRERWRGFHKKAFLGFFGLQALSVVVLALPFLLIGRDVSAFGWCESLGTLVVVMAICGEAVADHQMTRFRTMNRDRGKVCDVGLWRYSRHPNYFFESFVWAGFYLYACGSDSGWMTVHAPLVILYLLLRVTGVPPAEASSLASKGDAYRAYQRRTSIFIPLPPRTLSIHDPY